MPNTGDFSAYISFDNTNNPAAGGAYFIEQNLGANVIDSTVNHDLTFFARAENSNFVGTDMFVQIQWLDQDGSDGGGFQGEVLQSLIGLGINDSGYQKFEIVDMDVPDSADSFLLRFQVAAGAVENTGNGMFVDDVTLSQTNAIPEPTTAGLVLLGVLGTTLIRRKRE